MSTISSSRHLQHSLGIRHWHQHAISQSSSLLHVDNVTNPDVNSSIQTSICHFPQYRLYSTLLHVVKVTNSDINTQPLFRLQHVTLPNTDCITVIRWTNQDTKIPNSDMTRLPSQSFFLSELCGTSKHGPIQTTTSHSSQYRLYFNSVAHRQSSQSRHQSSTISQTRTQLHIVKHTNPDNHIPNLDKNITPSSHQRVFLPLPPT